MHETHLQVLLFGHIRLQVPQAFGGGGGGGSRSGGGRGATGSGTAAGHCEQSGSQYTAPGVQNQASMQGIGFSQQHCGSSAAGRHLQRQSRNACGLKPAGHRLRLQSQDVPQATGLTPFDAPARQKWCSECRPAAAIAMLANFLLCNAQWRHRRRRSRFVALCEGQRCSAT